MNRSVLLAGATGLVGNAALHLLLADPRVGRVVVLGRKRLGMEHPKLMEWIALDGDLLTALKPDPVDAVICCLGTTMANVGGNRERFIHVDKDLVVGLGRWAKQEKVEVFCVVSAVGADASSRIFYNRVKGGMERDLKAIGFPKLHIFQPSILTGPRREVRRGERVGIVLTRLVAPLLPMRYRPMPHDILAKALTNAMFEPGGGTYRYADILRLSAVQKRASLP